MRLFPLLIVVLCLALASSCRKEGPATGGKTDGETPTTGTGDPNGSTALKGWPVLEPFRGDGITFGRPAGMVQKNAPVGTYLFEREQPVEDDANRFELVYLGRIALSKLPDPEYLIRQTLAARNLTLVGSIVSTAHLYAEATGDTGVAGPHRFVRICRLPAGIPT